MLCIKEFSLSPGKIIKMLITIDSLEDIILMAQLLYPLAKQSLVDEKVVSAENVYDEVIELGKSQFRLFGPEPVYMASVARFNFAQHYYDGICAGMCLMATNKSFLEIDEWKEVFENFGRPYFN